MARHDEPKAKQDGTPAVAADHLDKFGYATAEGLSIEPSDDPDAEEFYLGWD